MKSLLFATLFVSQAAIATCNDLYPNNTPIKIANTVELCNSFYVSLYDTKRHAVVAVSEHLKKSSPVGSVSRTNNFHSDTRVGKVPATSQYTNSGYDRGHMAPADNASTVQEMNETFLMTNITPQVPSLNQGQWKKLEGTVRTIYSYAKKDVYVLTIAEYKGPSSINGIPVPSAYWKVIYADGATQYWRAENKVGAKVTRQSPIALSTLWK